MCHDYIPSRDVDLLAWALNFGRNLIANMKILNLDPKKVDAIQFLTFNFKSNLEKARDPEHTRMDVVHKNVLKKELRQNIRYYVNANLNYNPAMTPALRAAMRLSSRDSLRSRAMRPASRPRIDLKPGIRLCTIRYSDEMSGRRAKPKGVRGIVYHWAILNEPPESHQNLTMTSAKSSGPLVLEFNENQRGKMLYVSARWENSLGEPGPWSDIVKTYVA